MEGKSKNCIKSDEHVENKQVEDIRSFIDRINKISSECVLESQDEKRVVVYTKPWGIEDAKYFSRIGGYRIKRGEKADRLDLAQMWLHPKFRSLRPLTWDVGYGDPENLGEYVDSDFLFIDGIEGVEGFNFVYPDGLPEEWEDDDSEEQQKPIEIQREKPSGLDD